jgi:hypothetical protein
MKHMKLKLIQGCFGLKVLQQLEKNHQKHLVSSPTDIGLYILCLLFAKNS